MVKDPHHQVGGAFRQGPPPSLEKRKALLFSREGGPSLEGHLVAGLPLARSTMQQKRALIGTDKMNSRGGERSRPVQQQQTTRRDHRGEEARARKTRQTREGHIFMCTVL